MRVKYGWVCWAVGFAMPEYRRVIIPGGTFFFTIVTLYRFSLFSNHKAVALLGDVIRECKIHWPMAIDAIVLLPDHWHTIWTLPSGDSEYSKRIGWIKKEFTRKWLAMGNDEFQVSVGQKSERRRGIWQPRFWEHAIQDDDDFERHFDYIHWNPVKHGLVKCPKDWAMSSFHRWARVGVYPADWGCSNLGPVPVSLKGIKQAGEP